MEDQNKAGPANGKGPISSGIAPGPGEHRVEEALPPQLVSAVRGGAGGREGASSAAASIPRHTRQAWHWPTSESMSGRESGNHATHYRSGYSPGRSRRVYYAVGAIAAGFLLQRVWQSAPVRRRLMQNTTGGRDEVYGTDASLDTDRRYGLETAYAPQTDAQTDTAGGYSTKIQDAKSLVAERARRAGDEIRSRLRTTSAQTRTRLSDMGNSARTQVQRARDGMGNMQQEQPLLVGAIGLALGAGLGAFLAVTQRERAMLGDTRDKVMDKAKATAMKRFETAKESAQRIAEFAKQEARRAAGEIGVAGGGAERADAGTRSTTRAEDAASAELGRS